MTNKMACTPNSSKFASILLQLKDDDEQIGLCNLQSSDALQTRPDYSKDTLPERQWPLTDRCNCKKSKCLKLYCQCFAGKAMCNQLCRCKLCENNEEHLQSREAAIASTLERNHNAFDAKYKQTLTTKDQENREPSGMISVAHKNGCRCRKSQCLKKYCECFEGGVTCSGICTCVGCMNTVISGISTNGVGLKDGTTGSVQNGCDIELREVQDGPEMLTSTCAAARPVSKRKADSAGLDEHPHMLSTAQPLQPAISNINITRAALQENILQALEFKARTGNETGYLAEADLKSNCLATWPALGAELGSKSSMPPPHKRPQAVASTLVDATGGYSAIAQELSKNCDPVDDPSMSFPGKPPLLPRAVSAPAVTAPAAATTSTTPIVPNMPFPVFTRELLEQLLYQELQSQGLLSSPYASLVLGDSDSPLGGSAIAGGSKPSEVSNATSNSHAPDNRAACPSIANTTADIVTGRAVSATGGVLSSVTPSAPSGSGAAGVARSFRGASPNSLNIATALALLAANATPNGLLRLQQQLTPSSSSAGPASLPPPSVSIPLAGAPVSSSASSASFPPGIACAGRAADQDQDPTVAGVKRGAPASSNANPAAVAPLSQPLPSIPPVPTSVDAFNGSSSSVIAARSLSGESVLAPTPCPPAKAQRKSSGAGRCPLADKLGASQPLSAPSTNRLAPVTHPTLGCTPSTSGEGVTDGDTSSAAGHTGSSSSSNNSSGSKCLFACAAAPPQEVSSQPPTHPPTSSLLPQPQTSREIDHYSRFDSNMTTTPLLRHCQR